MEFIDTNDFSVMATGEHYKASNVEWDPTGRYVVSSVSAWSHKVRKSCFRNWVKRGQYVTNGLRFADGYRILVVVVPRQSFEKK